MDATAHIIVAAELTNNASDAGELPAMIKATEDNVGAMPQQALADTRYKSEAVFEALAGSIRHLRGDRGVWQGRQGATGARP